MKFLAHSVLALIAFTLVAPVASAQKKTDPPPAPYTGPKKRIAVMPVEPPPEGSPFYGDWIKLMKANQNLSTKGEVGSGLTEMLTTALAETGRFILLERANIGDIKSEIAIGEELGNEKTAVKKGNVLGAQMLVRASVSEFTNNRSQRGGGISLGGVSLGGGSGSSEVVIDVKFVDPSTSKILFVAKAKGNSKSEAVGVGFKVGSLGAAFGGSNSQPAERAVRNAVIEAVNAIVKRLESLPWEARVAKVDGENVTINRGTQDGVKIGDTLLIYKPGGVIEDPETGETLGRDEDTLIGEATVTWVSDRVARVSYKGSAKLENSYVLKFK